jgi:hypothetical protein
VREDVFDRSERDHDERKGSVGGVEAVGPIDDEADTAVQSLVPGVVHSQSHCCQDPLAALSDGLGQGDERLHPTALRFRAEPVEEDADLFFSEVASKDRSQSLLSARRHARGRLLCA